MMVLVQTAIKQLALSLFPLMVDAPSNEAATEFSAINP